MALPASADERFFSVLCLIKHREEMHAEDAQHERRGIKGFRSLQGRIKMLELFAIILAVVWILSMAASYTMGGFIHSFLVFAIAIIVYRVATKQECY